MLHNPVFVYVEDEPLSRTVMMLLLTKALGYENVTIFEDSRNFITKLESLGERPDIIFLDIHVQPLNGFEMLAELRAHPAFRDAKIIALTASVMNEEVDLLKTAGFDGGIAKPIDQMAFPDLLRRILAGEEIWHIA